MTEHRADWITRWLPPIGLFVFALGLRAWLVGSMLPYVEHVDEPAVIEVAIRMVRDGDFNPHIFLYPSLYYYLLGATTKLHVWWGVAAGLYQSDQDIPFKNNGVTSAPALFMWARALTALLGAATVPALLALGRRMFDWRVGLLAAVSLSVTAFHVTHSHYITVDAPTGLWVTLALLAAWEVVERGSWRGYLLAGAAAGLAAGTKYNAGVIVPAIMVAHMIHWRWAGLGRPFLRLAASGLAAMLAFLISTPYALLDMPTFLGSLRFNASHYAEGGHGDFVGTWPILRYASFYWDSGLLASGCLLLLLGLPLLIWRRPRQMAVLLSAAAPVLLLLLSYAVHFTRNLLPIEPLLILIAAAGAVQIADAIAARLRARSGRALALGALAAALVLPQAARTYSHLDYWSRPHSMVEAAERLKQLPQGARIAAELPATLFGGQTAIFPLRRISDHSLDWYRANGYRYLAVNDDLRSPEDQAAYDQLRAAAQVLVAFAPRRAGVQPGPSGAILDLGEQLDAMPFARSPLTFGQTIALLGYEIKPGELRARATPLEGADVRAVAPGQPLQINLYWRALAAPPADYTLFIHVLSAAGETVAQRDLPLRYDDYPSAHWQAGELVIDRGDLALPALPPGEYRLAIGLYDAASGARLEPDRPDPTLLTLSVR